MSAKIFISYRREDAAGHAGRVHDRLEREFGRDLLFMDVDAIPLGLNFVKVLREEVARCDVLLAVIGPNWLEVRGADGTRRLDDANDFVRIEIATALQRDIPVIPILLDNARIPMSGQLPPELMELSQRNGLDVRHASFHLDMDKLVRGIRDGFHRRTGLTTLPPPLAGEPSPQNAGETVRPQAHRSFGITDDNERIKLGLAPLNQVETREPPEQIRPGASEVETTPTGNTDDEETQKLGLDPRR